MNRRRFLAATALAAGGMLAGPAGQAQIIGINDAINKSGRQRMLSQRMAKAYLQVGQTIDTERSKKILDDSIVLFERQFAELKSYAPTADYKATLQQAGQAWQLYKEALTAASPNPEDARKVLVLNEDVLSLAQSLTLQLEKLSGTAAARQVNLSGRQRMLSQRMAKFYQAINWGIALPGMQDKLLAARGEFVAALDQLERFPGNTADIGRELQLARQQWLFFDNAVSNAAPGPYRRQQALHVATSSERILEVMDRITGMYEKLG
jgi:hypothetical protein